MLLKLLLVSEGELGDLLSQYFYRVVAGVVNSLLHLKFVVAKLGAHF